MATRKDYMLGDAKVAVVTSWDDGHVTDLQIAEWLKDRCLRGTFFLTTHALGQMDDGVMVLTEEEALELASQPHVEIGAHTHGHQRIECMCAGDRLKNLTCCQQELARIIGKPVKSFAYPFGDCSDDERLQACENSLRAAGFASGRLMKQAVCGTVPLSEVWRLRYRLPISYEFENVETDEIKCLLEQPAQTSDRVVIHMVGHSARVKRECGNHMERKFKEALDMLSQQHESYSPDEVWFCTQGELIDAARELFGS